MNERRVLQQRADTLRSLLEASDNVLGPAGASLSARLRENWVAELRLVRRLLEETLDDNVRSTIALWQERTAAFLDRAADPSPGWTDRSGAHWDAVQVLSLLEDTVERLDSWLLADEPLGDGSRQEGGL